MKHPINYLLVASIATTKFSAHTTATSVKSNKSVLTYLTKLPGTQHPYFNNPYQWYHFQKVERQLTPLPEESKSASAVGQIGLIVGVSNKSLIQKRFQNQERICVDQNQSQGGDIS